MENENHVMVIGLPAVNPSNAPEFGNADKIIL